MMDDFDMDNDYFSMIEEDELTIVGRREADEDVEVERWEDDEVFDEDDDLVVDQ
jgi:hypothetical protein